MGVIVCLLLHYYGLYCSKTKHGKLVKVTAVWSRQAALAAQDDTTKPSKFTGATTNTSLQQYLLLACAGNTQSSERTLWS